MEDRGLLWPLATLAGAVAIAVLWSRESHAMAATPLGLRIAHNAIMDYPILTEMGITEDDYIGHGGNRVVFATKDRTGVLKVPRGEYTDCVLQNLREAERCAISAKNGGRIGPAYFPKCHMIDDSILWMEWVDPVYDYNAPPSVWSSMPEWPSMLRDSPQAGRTRDGRIVAYDFGTSRLFSPEFSEYEP